LVNDVDSQLRVLESLHDYAGSFGEVTAGGVRVSRTCTLEMVIDYGIDEGEVERMLARLRRLGLAISADAGAIILTDVPRLLDFARFIAARQTQPPQESIVAPVRRTPEGSGHDETGPSSTIIVPSTPPAGVEEAS
jgi:hypothetical protein